MKENPTGFGSSDFWKDTGTRLTKRGVKGMPNAKKKAVVHGAERKINLKSLLSANCALKGQGIITSADNQCAIA